MRCKVRNILRELLDFIAACGERGIAVGLSSWFRRDTGESWRRLCTPRQHAAAWITVLDAIQQAGLMEHILFCDLCNEWSLHIWCPFFYGKDKDAAAVAGQGQVHWSVIAAWPGYRTPMISMPPTPSYGSPPHTSLLWPRRAIRPSQQVL